MKTTLAVMVMMSLAASAGAQVVVHEQQAKAATEQHLQVLTDKIAQGGLHVTFEAKPVTGAPYAGEAVTETIQVLADGNRIVRRTTSKIYRDGQGRTRRETLGPDGQVVNVVITNPAGNTTVVFDPSTNTAHRTGVATFVTTSDGSAGVAGGSGAVAYYLTTDGKQQAELKAKQEAAEKGAQQAEQKAAQQAEQKAKQFAEQKAVQQHLEQHAASGGVASGVTVVGPGTWVSGGSGAVWSTTGHPSTREELGEQVVEGVTAKGIRTTTVIPAGAIGNEQPITITSEEWFSNDLKVLVMTKHVDPRAGETTYRLTNITRNEPNPSLFELPAGITVK